MVFFGIIPVSMTFYIMSHEIVTEVLLSAIGVGLMGANILIVNNYRDIEDDRGVGKHTLATVLGRKSVSVLYLLNGWVAMGLMAMLLVELPIVVWVAPALYLTMHMRLWMELQRRSGRELNKLLGMTAMNMLAFSVVFMLIVLVV